MENNNTQLLAKHDLPQFYLLIVLYFLQGIPVGLTFGTIPFLLKSVIKDTTFISLGLFSIATYPYSLKIIWSPIVDSIYIKSIGRRRSWIIPIQLLSGIVLFILGIFIGHGYIFPGIDNNSTNEINILHITIIFTILIFLCATQDIAVDGWALTSLSQQSLSYASTAQTIGLNMGYFLSFTVFLAFNSNEFINKYFRSIPQQYGWITISGYLKFSGLIYILITIYIIFNTKEHPIDKNSILPTTKKNDNIPVILDYDEKDTVIAKQNNKDNIKYVYRCFIKILKLSPVQYLALIHLSAKFAFQCNEAVTNLKLLEKGFKREDLAITVLIDFPFEIIFGYYVAKWSTDNDSKKPISNKSNKFWKFLFGELGPLTPWCVGFIGRLFAAIMGNFIVYSFPKDGNITTTYFILVILQHLMSSFMSTVQFVSMSSFHTRVADPIVGGTYMTLLNTLSNFGGTWPRLLIMSLVNYLTVYKCENIVNGKKITSISKNICTTGESIILRDGYYMTNLFCIIIGISLYFTFFKKKISYLQNVPIKSWRCS